MGGNQSAKGASEFIVVQDGIIELPAEEIGPALAAEQQFTIAHDLGVAPAFDAYGLIPSPGSAAVSQFPDEYYVKLPPVFTYTPAGGLGLQYTFVAGIDDTNFYFTRSVFNGDFTDSHTCLPGTVQYYIYQKTVS